MSDAESFGSERKSNRTNRFEYRQISKPRTIDAFLQSDSPDSTCSDQIFASVAGVQHRFKSDSDDSQLSGHERHSTPYILLRWKSADSNQDDHFTSVWFYAGRIRFTIGDQTEVVDVLVARILRFIFRSFRLPYDPTTLPRTLCTVLDDYELCAHCVGPCLMNYGEIVVPRQLSINGMTVHVTAASQSFAVPVQERYCSLKCFNYGLKRAGRWSNVFSSLSNANEFLRRFRNDSSVNLLFFRLK